MYSVLGGSSCWVCFFVFYFLVTCKQISSSAIIAGANENDRKAAERTVCGRDFSLSNLGSRQTLSAFARRSYAKVAR